MNRPSLDSIFRHHEDIKTHSFQCTDRTLGLIIDLLSGDLEHFDIHEGEQAVLEEIVKTMAKEAR